jgi:hypothetical protein
MQSLTLRPTETENSPLDLAREIMRLSCFVERRRELVSLQEELRLFKSRYTQVVGSRLAELADIERAIKEAEARLSALKICRKKKTPHLTTTTSQKRTAQRLCRSRPLCASCFGQLLKSFTRITPPTKRSAAPPRLWPKPAAPTPKATSKVCTLLGDEHLQSYCANGSGARDEDEEENPANRLLGLKDELRTIEFGIKRITQDSLYQLNLSCDVEAAQQRDALAAIAERIARQIIKARHRLEHVS